MASRDGVREAARVWPFLATLGMMLGPPVLAEEGLVPGHSRIRVTAPGVVASSATGTYLSMLLGAVLGVAIGSAIAPDEAGSSYGEDYGKGVYILGGIAGGLLLGGAIGSSIRSDKWEAVASDSWRLGPDFPRSGRGLGIAVRF